MSKAIDAGLRSELCINSQARYLGLVRAHSAWFCAQLGLPECEAGRITLALVEAVTNVIRHAYDDRDDEEIRILFRAVESPRTLEFEILDRGRHVAQSDLRGREPDEGKPGGLGLKLMDCCMDSVEYHHREGGGSRWILRKSCPEE